MYLEWLSIKEKQSAIFFYEETTFEDHTKIKWTIHETIMRLFPKLVV